MGVVVTGMHRSGTSAVAGAVAALGLGTGNGDLMRSLPDNPAGYFERFDVADFNDALLKDLGGHWDAPPRLEDRHFRAYAESDIQQLRQRLDLFDATDRTWFVKDPRLCLLLPLWDRLCLQTLPVILVVRDPAEVIASLRLRSGISDRRGLAIWLRYYESALRASALRPLFVLDYGQVVAQPDVALDALADFLADQDLPVQRSAAGSALQEGLRRQDGRDHTRETEHLLGDVHKAYEQLAALHAQPATPQRRLPVPELPEWAVEALDELTEVYELKTAAGWYREGLAPGESPKPLGQITAEFERDRLEEDLVQTLRSLQEVRAQLTAVTHSRTWRYSYRATQPLRKLRGR